jgi:hypothetical protein
MNRRLHLLLWVSILVVAVSAAIPMQVHRSNCGGNSAALTSARAIALLGFAEAHDRPDQVFQFSAANERECKDLASMSPNRWLQGAHFWVRTEPIAMTDADHKRIIVVCDTPYRNVPQQTFGSAPPTHAVGYSDGSAGLIPTAEFAALDLTQFKKLDELFPPVDK